MGSIPNDWKHLLRTETSQKYFFLIFCHNNKVSRKIKDFQNIKNKCKDVKNKKSLNPILYFIASFPKLL